MTNYLLDRDDIDKVSAIISSKNESSLRLLKKCRFRKSEDIANCFEKSKSIKLGTSKLG